MRISPLIAVKREFHLTGILIINPAIESYKNYFKALFCAAVLHFVKIFSQGKNVLTSTAEERSLSRESINLQAENLLHRHGNSILRIAYSYLQNMNDAEDILQDTLIQFLKTAPIFENATHEKAWLLRVAINLSKNKIKQRKVRETVGLNDVLVGEESTDLSFVWDAVNSLPIKYREIIHLYYHEGYATAEIASMLQKNDATVRSLLYRGKGLLKKMLREVYDFEE